MIALIFDVRAVRRFWLAEHPWRWKITALYGGVMVMIAALLLDDLIRVVS